MVETLRPTLIVDGDQQNREYLKAAVMAQLNLVPERLMLASTIREAREILFERKVRIEFLIIDLTTLPEKEDARGIIEEVRYPGSVNRDTRIIAVSPEEYPGIEEDFKALGADVYLPKPYVDPLSLGRALRGY